MSYESISLPSPFEPTATFALLQEALACWAQPAEARAPMSSHLEKSGVCSQAGGLDDDTG